MKYYGFQLENVQIPITIVLPLAVSRVADLAAGQLRSDAHLPIRKLCILGKNMLFCKAS
jgi:hypothetical protein